jgi:hypothetical protein
MSTCIPAVKYIAPVPDTVWNILQSELSSWDFNNDKYYFDSAFIRHKLKLYYTGDPLNTVVPDKITPVIDWCKTLIGDNYVAIRCFLNLIEPGHEFPIHVDTLQLHQLSKRLHISLSNAEDCFYYTYNKVGEQYVSTEHKMELCKLYELDNINPHSVINKGKNSRVNFIVDMIPVDQIGPNLLKINIEQMGLFKKLRKQA